MVGDLRRQRRWPLHGFHPIRFYMQEGRAVATAKALFTGIRSAPTANNGDGDGKVLGGSHILDFSQAFDVYELIFWMDHIFSRNRGDYMEKNRLINLLTTDKSKINFFELFCRISSERNELGLGRRRSRPNSTRCVDFRRCRGRPFRGMSRHRGSIRATTETGRLRRSAGGLRTSLVGTDRIL